MYIYFLLVPSCPQQNLQPHRPSLHLPLLVDCLSRTLDGSEGQRPHSSPAARPWCWHGRTCWTPRPYCSQHTAGWKILITNYRTLSSSYTSTSLLSFSSHPHTLSHIPILHSFTHSVVSFQDPTPLPSYNFKVTQQLMVHTTKKTCTFLCESVWYGEDMQSPQDPCSL